VLLVFVLRVLVSVLCVLVLIRLVLISVRVPVLVALLIAAAGGSRRSRRTAVRILFVVLLLLLVAVLRVLRLSLARTVAIRLVEGLIARKVMDHQGAVCVRACGRIQIPVCELFVHGLCV